MFEDLQLLVDRFTCYQCTGDLETDRHAVNGALSSLLAGIRLHEQRGVDRATLRDRVAAAYEVVGQSVLFRRLQTWPRGYPGDFETIEYIMAGDNRSQERATEFHVEQYALTSAAAQQHRNKVAHQGMKMLDTARRVGRARILSIACGSSPDLRAVAADLGGRGHEFVLLDSDQDALDFTRAALAETDLSCQFVHGNLLRSIVRLRALGRFDLIVIGGLFDYLRDATIVTILASLRTHNLGPDGRIFFTNIAEQNPDRVFMEYLADWCLLARTSVQLRWLTQHAGFEPDRVTLGRDTTKLTHLVECARA